jgi:cyclophilin family peptidyl-prolyl cis-trans isomerase
VKQLLARLFPSRSDHADAAVPPLARPCVEALEGRTLLHNPFITSAVADNRGEAQIQFDSNSTELSTSLFNQNSVQMFKAGADNLLGTSDDVHIAAAVSWVKSSARLIVRGAPGANVPYRIRIVASQINAGGGFRLDGDFNGTFPSGNGVAGGNFEMKVVPDTSTRPLVRMSTVFGTISLRMLRDIAPATVNNFFTYANAGNFDNIFFTRNVPNFIIQLGSLRVNSSNTVVNGPVRAPVVNEFRLHNTLGTVAMAKQGGNPNSATNQFFFNLANNSSNLDNQNGGFTVFAQVANTSSLSVAKAVARRDVVALHNDVTGHGVLASFPATGLTDTPVRAKSILTGTNESIDQFNTQRFVVTGNFNPTRDLVIVRRTSVAGLIRAV